MKIFMSFYDGQIYNSFILINELLNALLYELLLI